MESISRRKVDSEYVSCSTGRGSTGITSSPLAPSPPLALGDLRIGSFRRFSRLSFSILDVSTLLSSVSHPSRPTSSGSSCSFATASPPSYDSVSLAGNRGLTISVVGDECLPCAVPLQKGASELDSSAVLRPARRRIRDELMNLLEGAGGVRRGGRGVVSLRGRETTRGYSPYRERGRLGGGTGPGVVGWEGDCMVRLSCQQ